LFLYAIKFRFGLELFFGFFGMPFFLYCFLLCTFIGSLSLGLLSCFDHCRIARIMQNHFTCQRFLNQRLVHVAEVPSLQSQQMLSKRLPRWGSVLRIPIRKCVLYSYQTLTALGETSWYHGITKLTRKRDFSALE
jgi:hypothetical protein